MLLPLSFGSEMIVLSSPAPVSFGEKLEGLELLEVPSVTEASGAPLLFDGVDVGVGAVILIAGAEFVVTAAGGGTGAGVGVGVGVGIGAGAGAGIGAGAEAVALAVGGVDKPLLAEALALLEVPPGADAV